MAASSLVSTVSRSSDLVEPQEPHERTSLIAPGTRNELSQSPTHPRTSESGSADAGAGIGASSSGKAGAAPTSTTGIVGVISVLLLGMDVLLYDHTHSRTKALEYTHTLTFSGVFIANADGSIVLATYGIISSDIGSLDDASWLVVTYTLAMCAIQPTYGKLSDIYGRKYMLIAAYSFFGFGCALCGAGTTTWHVVIGRAVAGVGGAGMTSLVSILIADKVPLRDIAAWRGYVNVASTVGRSAGGPFGGYLADTIGWRWSFYIQCPLALISIILVAWKLDNPYHLHLGSTSESAFKKLRRVDFLGSACLALTIVGCLIALDLGGQKLPWNHPIMWMLIISSAVLGLFFLLVEAYWAKEPIFPLSLLIHKDVVTAYLTAGFQIAAQFAVMFTIPLYFQVTARTSVTKAGAHLFPAVLGNALGGLLCGYIIRRTASYKALTIGGAIISSTAYMLLVFFWRGKTNIWESLYIGPGGFGTGIVMATTFIGIAAGVEESKMAIASTGLYLSANVGCLVGASLASTILRTSLRNGLNQGLKGYANRESIIQRALSDLHYVQSLDGQVRHIVVESYVHSFVLTYEFSLTCSLLAFLVALVMREHDLG